MTISHDPRIFVTLHIKFLTRRHKPGVELFAALDLTPGVALQLACNLLSPRAWKAHEDAQV